MGMHFEFINIAVAKREATIIDGIKAISTIAGRVSNASVATNFAKRPGRSQKLFDLLLHGSNLSFAEPFITQK